MKIGIITLYGNNNYGNKLQNYALQKKIIDIKKDVIVKTFKTYNGIFNLLKKFVKRESNSERTKCFLEFNNNIIYDSKFVNVNKPLIRKDYDMLVFGSDQVWNCDFEGKTNLFSGNFKHSAKKISYAASFGKNYVDEKYMDIYRKSLNEFNYISVREEKGREIINNIINKNVDVLIDPTMLLTQNEWDEVCKKPIQLNCLKKKKYILNYFLGNLSEKRKMEINRVAEENDCEIINILDYKSPFYQTGPSEFLYLEKNAFLICTDSFHSCVFALLYNKPFVVFDREDKNNSMNSRIDTLISKFKLENRIFDGKITKKNLIHNYDEAYQLLEKERKKSCEFLKKVLDVE